MRWVVAKLDVYLLLIIMDAQIAAGTRVSTSEKSQTSHLIVKKHKSLIKNLFHFKSAAHLFRR